MLKKAGGRRRVIGRGFKPLPFEFIIYYLFSHSLFRLPYLSFGVIQSILSNGYNKFRRKFQSEAMASCN